MFEVESPPEAKYYDGIKGRWINGFGKQGENMGRDGIIIRNDVEKYMSDLKKWLHDTEEDRLEEMDSFFTRRLDGYEEHMSVWKEAYIRFADLLPDQCREVLDIGCGTGLELDEIWKRNQEVSVIGIDLSQGMLDQLTKKHSDKKLKTICADYFQYEFGDCRYDAVISFESLHHFMPEKKRQLYRKIYRGLKTDGVFLLGDYIACCDEEEELLRDICHQRRERDGIPEGVFVHFDTPLTLEHELRLLASAGFGGTEAMECVDGATMILVRKK